MCHDLLFFECWCNYICIRAIIFLQGSGLAVPQIGSLKRWLIGQENNRCYRDSVFRDG